MRIEIDTANRTRRLRNGRSRLAVAACSALLAACQHSSPPASAPAAVEVAAPTSAAAAAPVTETAPVPNPATVTTDEDALADLLRYAERLRAMGAVERKQELITQGTQVPKSGQGTSPAVAPSPKILMQFALALLQTREPVETARALGLLQRVASSTEADASAYTALAHVLIDNLTTIRRLEDNLERTTQQLRESQRRIDALNERLDAMRAIERSMNAPPPPHGPRPVRP
ncbi:hypothetical protein [Hydrogenophaga sp. PAMC20947]|uniref:hypothetical protein n=1 Tax=Hydrogenophaga sp. PAMC20947 TaxID=2565558 RepID=UPI00109DE3DD|nr:hypothetical protein [Hydrogenophaga sp. PAMC20947]QCB48231.1 hypothetical protein E5678_20700 [Hydrogenophaga sp. PAMC20947]